MLPKNKHRYPSMEFQRLIFIGFIILITWISLDIFEIYQRDPVFVTAILSTLILSQIWSIWRRVKTLIEYTRSLEIVARLNESE